jgi:sporulation protein YqfC
MKKPEHLKEKPERLKENLVNALEIPRDLAYREAIITITGPNQAVVENYRSIQKYTREEIVILTGKGRVSIVGKRLEIPCYTPEEMQVKGVICNVFLER